MPWDGPWDNGPSRPNATAKQALVRMTTVLRLRAAIIGVPLKHIDAAPGPLVERREASYRA